MPPPVDCRCDEVHVHGSGRTSPFRRSAAKKCVTASTVSIPVALLLLSALALVGGGASGEARASIHVCPVAGGGTVFQDRPCERGVSESGTRTDVPARSPAGVHRSWLARPAHTAERARCDSEGCSCGKLLRPLDGGIDIAVADALYLDGAWHRHDESVEAARNGTPDAPGREALRRAEREATCDLLIAQQIIRLHAEPTMASLRQRVREAEERGLDDPLLCDTGDPRACESLDTIERYRRMAADLAALRTPRDGGADETEAGSPRSGLDDGLTADRW